MYTNFNFFFCLIQSLALELGVSRFQFLKLKHFHEDLYQVIATQQLLLANILTILQTHLLNDEELDQIFLKHLWFYLLQKYF